MNDLNETIVEVNPEHNGGILWVIGDRGFDGIVYDGLGRRAGLGVEADTELGVRSSGEVSGDHVEDEDEGF